MLSLHTLRVVTMCMYTLRVVTMCMYTLRVVTMYGLRGLPCTPHT